MSDLVDTGKMFTKLKAIVALPKTLRGSPAWLCKCACGSFIIVSESMLTGNRRTHCGCGGSGKPAMFRVQPNQRVNMLTLISYVGRLDDSGEPIWLCKCDCGKIVEKPVRRVLHGLVKDCGCVFEKYIESREKDLTNTRHEQLWIISKTGKRNELNLNIWLCECDCGKFVELATNELRDRKSCGCYGKRLSTTDTGMLNQGGTNIRVLLSDKPPRSSSGVKGVYFRPETQKWRAVMIFKKKTVLEKEYDTFKEAVDARKKAEKMYHEPELRKYKDFHNATANEQKPRRKRGDISGVPGVTFHEGSGKWRARLKVKGKVVLDKKCDTLDEAVAARKDAEKLYLS